jgi:hypothetical protein
VKVTYSVRAPTISGLLAVSAATTHEKLLSYRQSQTASFGVGGNVSDAWNVAFSAAGQTPCVTWTEDSVGVFGGEVMFFN